MKMKNAHSTRETIDITLTCFFLLVLISNIPTQKVLKINPVSLKRLINCFIQTEIKRKHISDQSFCVHTLVDDDQSD